MRVVKVLLLIAFFFVCMVFFVQNTQMLATPLLLKMDVFGLSAETPSVPFYVVVLLAFVTGGFFSLVYFAADRIRLNSLIRQGEKRIKALEAEVASSKASAASILGGSYPQVSASETGSTGSSDTAGKTS